MNSAFVGYEELSRSRRVLAKVDNTLRDLLTSSYPSQPHSLIAIIIHSKYFPDFDWLKTHV